LLVFDHAAKEHDVRKWRKSLGNIGWMITWVKSFAFDGLVRARHHHNSVQTCQCEDGINLAEFSSRSCQNVFVLGLVQSQRHLLCFGAMRHGDALVCLLVDTAWQYMRISAENLLACISRRKIGAFLFAILLRIIGLIILEMLARLHVWLIGLTW